jgi:glycosyltransferase involved in cell wall biosynthesis
LRETLDSAIRQTVPALEVIVVDDGSTDDSAAIAESYGPPVRVLRQRNQGESVAMNRALALAHGSHTVFLGADDVLHPRLLEIQLRALDGVLNGVACTGFSFFVGSVDRAMAPIMPQAETFFPAIIHGNLAPPSCWMMARETIIHAGCFYAPQKYFEDWDLNWRVGLTGATLVPVKELGFYYRQHPKSQLASLGDAERAHGHAWVIERMGRALLDRDDLLAAHGDTLFWSACVAARSCRAFGVPWARLRFLANVIEEVARRRPARLKRSAFVRAVDRLGFRRAEALNRLRNGPPDAPVYRPAWLSPQPPRRT